MKMVYADAFMRARIDRENELYRIYMQTAAARKVRKISIFLIMIRHSRENRDYL